MIENDYCTTDFIKKSGGIFAEHTVANHNITYSEYDCEALIYVAHGDGRFHIDNASCSAQEGDVFLIKSKTPHCFTSTLPVYDLSVYCCLFLESLIPYRFTKYKDNFPELKDFFDGNKKFILVSDNNKIIRNYMIKMLDDYSYSQPASEYSVQYALNIAITDLFRIFCAECNKKSTLNSNMTMGMLINYINQNIHSKISISTAAALFKFTPSYLCRLFKKNTGMTFSEFVNKVRVDKIKDALENTDRPIYVIYDDFELTPQYINRIFKNYTGYSLDEYKNKFNYKVNNPLFNS